MTASYVAARGVTVLSDHEISMVAGGWGDFDVFNYNDAVETCKFATTGIGQLAGEAVFPEGGPVGALIGGAIGNYVGNKFCAPVIKAARNYYHEHKSHHHDHHNYDHHHHHHHR